MRIDRERFERGYKFTRKAVSADFEHVLTIVAMQQRALKDLVMDDDALGRLLIRDVGSFLDRRGVKDAG